MLVVAGVDPGGGAGVAADVRAIAAAGAFACPVIATLTVQSTSGLLSQHPIAPSLVVAQAECVLDHQRVRVIKTGALGSASNVRAVARLARAHHGLPLVVDPVRVPTRGRTRLLDDAGFAVLARELVPRATIVTANVDEARALTGIDVVDVDGARRAARAIVALGARAALVKGGHLATRTAIDVLAIGDDIVTLEAPRLDRPLLHGGGCTLASFVAARLARAARVDEKAIVEAASWSKSAHHRALRERLADVGGRLFVLDVRG